MKFPGYRRPTEWCDRPKTFYIHRNEGKAIFVKEAAFFESQGGLIQPWGNVWHRIFANSLAEARTVAEKFTDKEWASCIECGGWGHPTGCDVCSIYCMGG